MNLWFLSWLLSENTSPSQSRQTKYELRAVSSKVGLLEETSTLQNEMPEQMLCVLKPDIRSGSLSTQQGSEWEHSPSSQLGCLCLQEHRYITRPLTQRHQADIEDELITSQGFPFSQRYCYRSGERQRSQERLTWQNDTGTSSGSMLGQEVVQLFLWRLREQVSW